MSSRPLGLRRRDAHLVCIVLAVFAANVGTTVCYWLSVRFRMREVTASVSALESASDETRAQVSAVADSARALSEAFSLLPASVVDSVQDPGEIEPPVILGWGRTKTAKGTPIVYYDVRKGEEVTRQYVTPSDYARMLQGNAFRPSSVE